MAIIKGKGNIYYNNIKNLMKAEVKLDYTPYQIQEIMKCKNDIKYFLKTYVKVVTLDKGSVPFEIYPYQERMIENIVEHNRIIALQPRQSGKTVGIAGYILHYIIFNSEKYVAILANKGATARKILTKIKNMYKSLPIWLQQGVIEWNMGSITLGNKTSIIAEATSPDGIRGDSVALLYIDETAFIENSIWDAFWASTL